MRPDSVRIYERQFVGCALRHPEIVDETGLTPADFSTAWAEKACKAILRLALNGDPVTVATVHDQDPELLLSDLSQAEDAACLQLQGTFFAREIRAASHRRRVTVACEEALRRLKEGKGTDPLPEVVDMLAAVLDTAPAIQQPKPLAHYVERLVEELPTRRERGRPGFSRGFPALDSLTGGLRPGSLFVVAAETGVGKSLFASNLLLGRARARGRLQPRDGRARSRRAHDRCVVQHIDGAPRPRLGQALGDRAPTRTRADMDRRAAGAIGRGDRAHRALASPA
jgi:replicative DNA helicase